MNLVYQGHGWCSVASTVSLVLPFDAFRQYNDRVLKKFLALLLLVVMPFQVAWSAADNYCQHEEGKAAQHFGHHLHQHQDGKFKGKASGGIDDDCAYCHLGGAILPPAVPLMATPFASSIPFAISPVLLSSLPAREPERPKWTARA